MMQILDDIRQSHGRVSPYEICAAVAVCCKGGDPAKALELFESLEEPDRNSFEAALQALSHCGYGEQAEELLFRMICRGDSSSHGLGGRAPARSNTACLNTVLAAYLLMLARFHCHLAKQFRFACLLLCEP